MARRTSILAYMRTHIRLWLDQRATRRECLRRQRLSIKAARKLKRVSSY
jgi:hypothetical protein